MTPLALLKLIKPSQRSFAARLGLDPSDVSRILQGKRVLPVRALDHLIKAGDLTSDEVVSVVRWMADVDADLAAMVGRRVRTSIASEGLSATEAGPQ